MTPVVPWDELPIPVLYDVFLDAAPHVLECVELSQDPLVVEFGPR